VKYRLVGNVGLFDDCQQLDYTTMKNRKVDDELEGIWKDVVVGLVAEFSFHLPTQLSRTTKNTR
jgi:hypothetical protein